MSGGVYKVVCRWGESVRGQPKMFDDVSGGVRWGESVRGQPKMFDDVSGGVR